MIQILCRRTKNNPVLIGEPGVGKTAIVEGLAQRISDGDVPPFLADKRILSLDLSLIVAGTKYRGQFEERLKTIMKELMESQNSIVFIDELHTLVGAGSAEGSLDAANILKPALSRGEIQCIGATTPGEYRKSVEKDRSLERRFQSVKVPAPNEEEAIQVISGVRERYEKFHAVSYTDEALRYSVYLSNRYIPDRFLPDKAIDLIDEAGARVKLRQASVPEEVGEVQKRVKFITHRMESAIAAHEFEKARFYSEEERKEKENLRTLRERYKLDDASTGIVTREDIEEVVSRWTGIGVTSIKEDEQQKLLRIEPELHKRVISQDKAITALARAIRRSRAGLKSPLRPVGCFFFLGPTGVGKTEVARRLAEFLFGSEKSLVRFDMSEFMEKHSVSKLIGAPPGYVGYEEGGQLTERVRRTPYSVILLDEIEKAHPDVFNILLQVFEDGQLTDGLGNTVDFRNTIIIMTSNLGARHLQKRTSMGFQSGADEAGMKSIEEMVMGEVKRAFNPEFLNRLDEVIIFNPLGDDDLLRIIDLLVGQLNDTLIHRQVQIVVCRRKHVSGFSKKRARIGTTERVHCGGLCRSTLKTRCRKRSFRVGSPGLRRSRFMSPGKALRSVRWVRQPRSSTNESDTTHGWSRSRDEANFHGRPIPGTAGEEQLGFGGAALTSSLAAQIKVCSSFGLLRARSFWIVGVVLLLASACSSACSLARNDSGASG